MRTKLFAIYGIRDNLSARYGMIIPRRETRTPGKRRVGPLTRFQPKRALRIGVSKNFLGIKKPSGRRGIVVRWGSDGVATRQTRQTRQIFPIYIVKICMLLRMRFSKKFFILIVCLIVLKVGKVPVITTRQRTRQKQDRWWTNYELVL